MNLRAKNTPERLGRALAESMRPRMALFSWLIYASVVIIHEGIDVAKLAIGLVLFISVYGFVALQNDLGDVLTDVINKRKDIPFARGSLTERQMLLTMIGLSFIASVGAIAISPLALLWVGTYTLLGYFYSGVANVKSRGIYAALLLGFCYGAMPWILGAIATGEVASLPLLVFAGISFIFSSGIIVIKDFKDIVGDRATGKKTMLVRRGVQFTRRYYLILTTLSYGLLALFCFVATGSPVFVLGALLAGLGNFLLLHPDAIQREPRARARRGNVARGLFFGVSASLYFGLVWF